MRELHIQSNVLICFHSSHTLPRHNQVLLPPRQSKCSPTLFIAVYFIYDDIFPCYLKVRRSRLAGRNRAAKEFHTDGAAFISHTGWDVGFRFCRRALSFIYSQSRVEIANSFFCMQNICYVVSENSESRTSLHVIIILQSKGALKKRTKKKGPEQEQRELNANQRAVLG